MQVISSQFEDIQFIGYCVKCLSFIGQHLKIYLLVKDIWKRDWCSDVEVIVLSSYVLFLQEADESSQEPVDQGPVMAVLAVIGGVDSRPRLGGLVQHKEWGLGTVCRIAPNGKVTVQCEGQQKPKICSISQVKPVRSSLLRIEIWIEFEL